MFLNAASRVPSDSRKIIAVFLALSLFSNYCLAAPEALLTCVNTLGEVKAEIDHKIAVNNLGINFFWSETISSMLKRFMDTKRIQTISRIEISPKNASVHEGEKVVFGALAYDEQGEIVQGTSFNWTSVDVEQTSPVFHMADSSFEPQFADVFVVTAEANGITGQAVVIAASDVSLLAAKERVKSLVYGDSSVVVRPDVASEINQPVTPPIHVSSRDILDPLTIKQRQEAIRLSKTGPAVPSTFEKGRAAKPPSGSSRAALIKTKATHGPSAEEQGQDDDSVAPNPAVLQTGGCSANNYDPNGSWNNSNYTTADDPGEQPGHPQDDGTGGAGSGNFSFSAPAVSLGERGDSGINLSLDYNSLLWHKANGQIIYDIDRGFPAPGWNIGFGKLMDAGGSGTPILESVDGTRHSNEGNIIPAGPPYSWYYGHTTDGSFIDYVTLRSSVTGISSGQAWFPNGTTIIYGAASDGVAYPTQITDRHGNKTAITYCNNVGPRINTITDNLGRIIQFNYDSSNLLVSITAPGYNNTTQTFLQLHYTAQTLSYTFSGLSPIVRSGTVYQIDSIYYPVTNTGYWFGDGDSYSSYGMLMKVVQQKGMASTGTTTTQGTVSAGTMTRQMSYNYPATASSLTDAPKYTTMAEDWSGRDTPEQATTTYNVDNTSSPRVTTLTGPRPDGTSASDVRKTITKLYSINNPGQWNDGIPFKTEVYSGTNALLSKTETTLELGSYNSARPTQVDTTDENGKTTKQGFTYDTYYNQVTSINDYGYGPAFALLRTKTRTYENSTDYRGNFTTTTYPTGRHVFSLIKSEEVFDAASTRLSRTAYTYDGSTPVAAPNATMFDPHNDPYTTQMYNTGNCLNWYQPPHGGAVCTQWEIVSMFQSATLKRGNVTQTTGYASASDLSGGVSYDFTYDVTGNHRTATTNCCQQMSFSYSTATQYSQPDSHTKGSSDTNSPLRMTESATYDFNTGAMLSSTDFNERTTTTVYDAVARPTLVTLPTGGKTTIDYDDANLSTTQTAKLSDNTTIVSKSTSVLNGRGQSVLSKYQAGAANWNAASVKYDAMGRKWKASLPYDASGSPSQWTEYAYDSLSRVTTVTASDGSTSTTSYNEAARPDSASGSFGQTVKTQDAWGRERWARTDDFGRLVEVVEPNPTGNGTVGAANSLKTSYSYDPLDNLVSITQESQTRSFKYDSLGRLTRQKLAEQTATISDAGCYVGTGCPGPALWSDAFTYDARSNITQRIDARGVTTTFSYLLSGNTDPLNRLQSISYSTTGADATYGAIPAANSVSLSYMTTGDQKRVASVTTSGFATETNSYDGEGRISDYTLTLANRTSYEMKTSYDYDTANRLTQITYPKQWGFGSAIRKTVAPSYDQASRLTQITANGQRQLGNVAYNSFGQVTYLETGYIDAVETYSYDGQSGLLTGQTVTGILPTPQTLLDRSYAYAKGSSVGTGSGKTGQMTAMTNNLDHNKDRGYEFDGLGRLTKAKGGTAAGFHTVTADWTQDYSYDRYGNKTAVSASGHTADSNPVPSDGIPSLSFDAATNRITPNSSTDWQYDNAGNLIRGQNVNGVWQKFEYDAAGRLVTVMDGAGNPIETYKYGADRSRLITEHPGGGGRTYYAWGGSSVIQEYTEGTSSTTPVFSKNYVYAGSRLLSTETSLGTEYHHSDRLGTSLVTDGDPFYPTSYEQSTLPFGTALNAESTGYSNQVFTSYDRSSSTGLDYAVNRTHSPGQGRFTQVDPIGMDSSSTTEPQSNNLFSYSQNNPIDFVDPSGLEPCDASYGWGICGQGFWGYGGMSGLLDISTRHFGTETESGPIISEYWYFTPDFGGFTPKAGAGVGGQKSDCAKFIDNLMALVDTYLEEGTDLLGHRLLVTAYSYSTGGIDPATGGQDSHFHSVGGFRSTYIANGQSGQVYQHLYGHAGARLIGSRWVTGAFKVMGGPRWETGTELADRMMNDDINQMVAGGNGDDHGPEAATEVQDDMAGGMIGAAIQNLQDKERFKNKNEADRREMLRNTGDVLFKLICDH